MIQRALGVIGQPLNPVRVVDAGELRDLYVRAAGVGIPGPRVNACRAPGDSGDAHIYVNRDSDVYMTATRRPSPLALLKLAATLVHEQVHNTDDELAAYRLQSDFVRNGIPRLPWRQQEHGQQYLQALEARAAALTWVRRQQHRGVKR